MQCSLRGHNLRMILAYLRLLCCALVGQIMQGLMLGTQARVRCRHRLCAEYGLFRADQVVGTEKPPEPASMRRFGVNALHAISQERLCGGLIPERSGS